MQADSAACTGPATQCNSAALQNEGQDFAVHPSAQGCVGPVRRGAKEQNEMCFKLKIKKNTREREKHCKQSVTHPLVWGRMWAPKMLARWRVVRATGKRLTSGYCQMNSCMREQGQIVICATHFLQHHLQDRIWPPVHGQTCSCLQSWLSHICAVLKLKTHMSVHLTPANKTDVF